MVLSLLEEQEYKRYIEAFDFSKYMNAPEETVENNSYSKDEIAKMPVAKLRELANEKGIDSADKSKSELKKILMEI